MMMVPYETDGGRGQQGFVLKRREISGGLTDVGGALILMNHEL